MLKKFTPEGRFESGLDEIVAGKLWAFVPVVTKHGVGLGVAVANEAGYNAIPLHWAIADTWAEMDAHADELNIAEGTDEAAAMRIVCSSMAAGKVRKSRRT